MKSRVWSPLLLCCVLFAAVVPTLQAADVADKQQIISKAKDSYYSLRKLGLDAFQASVKPTWEVTLKKELADNPAEAANGIKMLNGLHFSMTLDPEGNVKVTHSADAPPPNEQAAKGFEQIYNGMNQAVSGFFSTWSLFMLTSPLPEPASEYQLEDLGSSYRLSYKEGPSDIVTNMTKGLMITDITVKSPQFVSIIKPQFTKRQQYWLLSGYEGDYTPTSGPGVVHLNIKVNYQDASGFQLPKVLDMDTTYDGTPSQMQLVFSNYEVTRKTP